LSFVWRDEALTAGRENTEPACNPNEEKTQRLSRFFPRCPGLSVSPVVVSVVMPRLASFFLDDRIVSAGLCEARRRHQDRESNGKQQRD
jgi:hypothetical protein